MAARQPLHFSKMHGAGNDFVVLDLRSGQPAPDAALCRALADRHTGVGCDQILTIEPARTGDAVASYRIWNADGSGAGQCGNGARCVAAWLVREGVVAATRPFVLDSPLASHAVNSVAAQCYQVAMGVPGFAPALIPLHGFDDESDCYRVVLDLAPGLRIPDQDVTAGHATDVVAFGAVSMGNPHAVIVVDALSTAPVTTVAPALQQSRYFPDSVNVGFAQVLARDRIGLRVYERGVGETLACGSGACAAAAVLIRRGLVDRQLDVVLPGGTLRIDWPADDARILMSGPAEFVFDGEWLQ